MAKICDAIEIGLTRGELRQALRFWVNNRSLIHDYRVINITLHPDAKYVVRFTVEPPLAKADQEAIKQSANVKGGTSERPA